MSLRRVHLLVHALTRTPGSLTAAAITETAPSSPSSYDLQPADPPESAGGPFATPDQIAGLLGSLQKPRTHGR